MIFLNIYFGAVNDFKTSSGTGEDFFFGAVRESNTSFGTSATEPAGAVKLFKTSSVVFPAGESDGFSFVFRNK